jgi:FtsP/CotA-like multicopper oxidase with cupredoxin domain
MTISRRHFLRYAAGSGLALTLAPISSLGGYPSGKPGHGSGREVLGSGEPLRIPPTFSGGTITASVVQQRIWPDASTEVWAFGGTYPAPTIRVRRGDAFAVRLLNQLDEPTNIHWHGLTIPANMDGYPSDVAPPGGSFDYAFTVEQRAGVYWYHPHPDMRTGPQVYKGMAGLFIVEDDEEAALGLPGGEFEVPLLIQDRRSSPERTFDYTLSDDDHLDGYLGDTVLVNGTPDPYLEVAAGLYRFRVLNGSNARVFDLALADGSPMLVIGTDGGLLDQPYEASFLYLAPAERVDLLIDFSRYNVGDSVMLRSLDFGGTSGRKQGVALPVLRFDVTRPGEGTVHVPAALTPYERLDPAQAVRSRKFTMRIDHSTTPVGHTINGLMFDMERIDERVGRGDLELWTFENISFLHHPMHLHGAQFQVISRNGGKNPLAPRDYGWKDTIYVRPFESVQVAVRFASWLGKFLVHCHNLEHEDHGMMLNFEVGLEGSSGVEEEEPGRGRMELR